MEAALKNRKSTLSAKLYCTNKEQIKIASFSCVDRDNTYGTLCGAVMSTLHLLISSYNHHESL